MSTLPTILVVDDELRSLETLRRTLEEEFEVLTALNASEAHALLEREWVQVILCDQRMPGMSGLECLSKVRKQWPDVIRIIISGYTDSNDLIEAINQAAIYQYINKPWHPEKLLLKIRNAVELYYLQQQNSVLSSELKLHPKILADDIAAKRQQLQQKFKGDQGIIRSDTSCMNEICRLVRRVAPFDVNVLLSGESGTGKELCARSLHYNSLRQERAFVAENCGALNDELLESELFGYKRGAFTGAYEDRVGLFELADGGTLFLDEIGEISPAFQVKLLRVLQEGEIRPIGSNRRRTVDVRVIAATNRDLEAEVQAGRFREDLYYRLATFIIPIPSLRARKEDIPILVHSILEELQAQLGKPISGISKEAIDCLTTYHWPGNVRELQNELKRMLILAPENRLDADLISTQILHGGNNEQEKDLSVLQQVEGSLKQRMEALEARIVKESLIRHHWNKTHTAEELGLSRVGLRNKLERYGLEQIEGIDKIKNKNNGQHP
ncbi:MAG: sigma-54 dependent transcriptional regulator [Gammaproteobacteria bacterium]|nr:sigma-54 dependent transcriptional regulator [Gammaproteobacteria bacterium]